MSVYDVPNTNPKRRPSLRGGVVLDVVRGVERVRAWPDPRTKGQNQEQKQRNDHFRSVQWATKYLAPEMMLDIMEARDGMPLLPRDVATMLLYNTLAWVMTVSGKRMYPEMARNQVSESLDTISQTPGLFLVRGAEFWEAQPLPENPTESQWQLLTFGTAGVTKWAGKTHYRADQAMTLIHGETLEVEIKMKRTAGWYQAIALSSDGENCFTAPRQNDNNWVLYRYTTAAGASTAIDGGAFNVGNNFIQTLSLSTDVTSTASGYTQPIRAHDGLKSFKVGIESPDRCQLIGTVQPIWFSSQNGPADILQARYRRIGPFV